MDTATKLPQEARPKDRVPEALSALVTLLDRAIKQAHSLETEIQGEAARRVELELATTRTSIEEHFKSRMTEVSAEWKSERERLTAELAHRTQTAAQWEAERSRLNGEIERLTQSQAATRTEAQKAIAAVKQAAAAEGTLSAASEAISTEIARVEQMIKDISTLVEDPSTDLSTAVQKNVERAELEAYLRGIQFALGGGKSE
jgi:chromosome segregation ATPase